ncbi:amidohydrolase family protein [Pontibacter sp. KCTC 32443]|uniref:N-acyl-D-amino-acid deacylase family protein n=1 Tax=Pontibacter TaxID=323449 RepID=UPI00164DEEE9|nr:MULTISPECIES: amidohydrolase family protein [Pontibacter]MBC5774705.1 amidohydrolase family protein [Pontibacter sp. KCTC 32443]
MNYDLLITGATIHDGTGKAPYVADVWVKDDEIILIGKHNATSYTAKNIINGSGLILTPGFIDAHAHGEPFKTPAFDNFLSMGVTTICLGQDGFSPDLSEDSYTSGEALGNWMNRVDELQPGVNIVMFVGHNTIRMQSGTKYKPEPTEEDLTEMEQLLHEGMDLGCFGMTTGLEYNPGFNCQTPELDRLAKIVGERGGMIMSHMRSENDATIIPAIEELLSQGQYCPVQISHIKVVYGKGTSRAEEICKLLDNARDNGIKASADFYPYTASYTSIEILFPDWAKLPYDYEEVKASRGEELKQFLKSKIEQRNGPEATLLGTGPFKGKTLGQIAIELDKPFEEVLRDNIGPYGAFGAYFIMDEALQDTLLQYPYTMLCTDGSPFMNHPRSFGSFAKMIETFVLKKQLFSLEEGIRKMTGLTAETIGIPDRGFIKPGYKADLLLFDPTEIKANATFENPMQLSTGFRYVIVNGKVVKEQESFTGERNGRVLRKPQL